jgi:hypothetical protein
MRRSREGPVGLTVAMTAVPSPAMEPQSGRANGTRVQSVVIGNRRSVARSTKVYVSSFRERSSQWIVGRFSDFSPLSIITNLSGRRVHGLFGAAGCCLQATAPYKSKWSGPTIQSARTVRLPICSNAVSFSLA